MKSTIKIKSRISANTTRQRNELSPTLSRLALALNPVHNLTLHLARSESRHVYACLNCCRQAGKSTVVAFLALVEAPGHR